MPDDKFTELTGLIPGKTYNAEDIPRLQAEAKAKGLIREQPKPDVPRETKSD